MDGGSHFGFTDSADTHLIKYLEPAPAPPAGPAWFFNQSASFLGAVYESTLTGCNASGASVVYVFDGSNISVFGSVVDSQGNDPPVSIFRVDGGSPTTFTAPQTTVREDNVLFFSSPALPLGNHTLTVNITRASRFAPFYLDYLQYSTDVLLLNTSSTPLPPTTITASNSPSGTASFGLSAVLTFVSATPTPTTTTTSSTIKSTAPTGAIVGGVVGGLALIGFIIAALYWQHNRRPSGDFEYGTKAHQDAPPTGNGPSTSGPPTSRRRPGDGDSGESPDDDDESTSYLTSSAPTSLTHSVASATAPTDSVRPHSANATMASPANRRFTEMSYMRPPSTLTEGFILHRGPDVYSEAGGEILPAYTPRPS
ncbi:hypothetical protein C2E23DRAFT_884323 [Lenzites betulinus]|nr:hypothetical protein C2E23DRAFT_884323 [Lenzites betulinus]